MLAAAVPPLHWGEPMQSDFSVFRKNLAQACRLRKTSEERLSACNAVDLHFAGVRALDVYRLACIADQLDVSVDWLLGRSQTMEVPGAEAPRRKPFMVSRASD